MQDISGCLPGRRATATLTVTDEDTAVATGCGDVPVLATPRVLALAEHAAVMAMGSCLPDDATSVGAWVELEHLAPSAVGQTVEAEAVLLGVHGRRLEFSITCMSNGTEVAHLRHRRVIVSRSRFSPAAGASTDKPFPGPEQRMTRTARSAEAEGG